jgi:AcrR family transcriptional regulator
MKIGLSPRERILEKAFQLFYTQGYNLTGINQVLEESKVAKASLYQHFGSKEELGMEYIKKVRKDWFESFENHLARKTDFKEKLLAAFDFLEMNMKQNDFLGCRFLNLLSDIGTTSKKMQNQIIEHKSKLRSYFNDLAKAHIKSTKSAENIPNTGDTIFLLFEAAVVESKVHRDVWPIRVAKKSVDNILGT